MRIFASWSRHLALLVLAYTFQSGGFENGNFAPAQAQTVPKSLEQGGSDAALRNRKNNWTVGIAGGQLSGTYMTFANEMAEVLDDGDDLRVSDRHLRRRIQHGRSALPAA